MILDLGLCIAGLAVLLLGAEILTRNAVILAGHLGIPPIVVGLTIVAIGTSTPELAVGIDSGLRGQGEIAVANIAGTNIVNILLILGLSACLRPLALKAQTIRIDLPAIIIAAVLMLGMSLDATLSRLDGAVLLAAAVVYTVVLLQTTRKESRRVRAAFQREFPAPDAETLPPWASVRSGLSLVAGIALVVVSADWLVTGAVGLAGLWGVSDAFIGLTIIAIGTSAPELATTILSTLRGNRDVAIGNLLGSSIYNICIILGITCLVPSGGLPVSDELLHWDIPLMALVTVVCLPVFTSARMVSRAEGALFVAAYVGYLLALLITRT